LIFIVAPLFFEKNIKRAFELRDACGYKVKIYDGGFYRYMSQEPFDGIYIGAMGQQMCCEGMS
jgi:hypothetical protein